MGLLIECPKCHIKFSEKNQSCKECGYKFGGGNLKIYWVDFYANGKRIRQKVGTSKREAEIFLGKKRTQVKENRLWDKKVECTDLFEKYAEEYLNSSRVKSYRSYKTERSRVTQLKIFFKDTPVNKIAASMIED